MFSLTDARELRFVLAEVFFLGCIPVFFGAGKDLVSFDAWL